MIKSKPSKLNAAFTSTELLIFISLVGILVLIGIPAFRTYRPSLELSGTVRELVSDLRYAEQLAVTEQVNYGVRFSSSTDKYQIIKFGATEEIIEEKTFPSTVSFDKITGLTGDEAIFNPYGAVQESGIIILINTKNSTTSIDIRPSGFVKVTD